MILYSHYVLAAQVEPFLKPDNLAEYYWGTLIPDVRYLAGVPRKQTHLPQKVIAAWAAAYPNLRSFVLGYRVHCLLDEIDLVSVVSKVFPINLLQQLRHKEFSQQQIAVLTEMYFLKNLKGLANTRTDPIISGEENEIIASLGIAPEDTTAFAGAARDYITSPSPETALAAFQRMGILESDRADTYIHAARAMQKNWVLQTLLLYSVRNAHLERIAWNKIRTVLW